MTRSTIFLYFAKGLVIILALLLIVACLYGTIWDADIVFFDLLALLLPYLVIANLFSGLLAAVVRSRFYLLPVTSLLIWIFTLGSFYVFSLDESGDSKDDISVLSYNVQELEGNYRMDYAEAAPMIMDFVLEEDAEIVCFQEYASTAISREKMKIYPYEYRLTYYEGRKYSPMGIFSKFPIISRGSLNFQDTFNNAIYADLLIKSDTLRVYNVHLQSLRFRAGSVKRENTVRLFNRLGNTIRKQKEQVEILLDHTKSSPYPFIICGDLNNTQYSKVYRTLKGDLKDTFLEKGNGLGRTLLLKFLPFRIDYILVDPDFEITSHSNYDVEYSDHYPVRASFRLPEK
ncbi:endonuclease/exonuclease/phosphatase family protein [Muriicola marianensis]|uniref:Endonuclease n=1 Tax=Muriicola marianensis TaxID=1324801 RepID=A0ABQ1R6P1_9FLAO|nr:endonuclease/exonuclease/phosphatase family protein [Muriicola marianensis]GGD57657.1 endonuclease [Muriicola marianensis]